MLEPFQGNESEREDWLKRTGAMRGGGSSAARVHAEPVTQWERTAEPDGNLRVFAGAL